MIVVTGGAGFIGSNIVKELNKLGHRNILVVDDLTDGTKFQNIVDCDILDYEDKDVFINKIIKKEELSEKIKVIFHQGACSTTTEWNGKFMMQNNYEYSKSLFHYCLGEHIPFIYASSAAVYGNSTTFLEKPEYEKPLNVYGYSKLLFDQYVRRFLPSKSPVVGLRYFNVYGPNEQHKGTMASVAFHLQQQLLKDGKVRLFEGSDGYANGEQVRDFIYVEDVAKVNIWFWQKHNCSGIYNLGTGKAQSFNSVARAIVNLNNRGEIEYIPFPNHLRGRYQSYTQADITSLRQAGCHIEFRDITAGIKAYFTGQAS